MALLCAYKISKSFGARLLFENISFEVSAKDHIGFIGANGSGKTTLLMILSGREMPDSGQVHRNKLLQISTLQQIPDLSLAHTVFDVVLSVFDPILQAEAALQETALMIQEGSGNLDELIHKQHALQEQILEQDGLTIRSRTRSALLGLGFSDTDQQKEASALSGGELNKIMLARVLLCKADVLLLDEPTNHLDIKAVEWLEGYLKSYTGAYIVISHDRYFLDQVTDKTMELSNGEFYMTAGNYTRHMELRMGEQEAIRRKYHNTQKEIRRIESIVEQQRRWNRERNIKTAESKLKQIERLKSTLVMPEKKEASINFTFQAKEAGGEDILSAQGIGKAYGEQKLFSDVSLHITRGERVFLLGRNGAGKTTLLNILAGKDSPDTGTRMLGVGVTLNYYEQNMCALRLDNTVLNEVWEAYPRLQRKEVHNALAAFLFRGNDVEKTIGMLSGGERARIQLLKLMLSGGNLILLDEPTNHLDIASREALEQALEEYNGALLIVTHDRYLVNRLADRVLYLQNNGLVQTIGGYDAFLSALEEEEKEETQKKYKPANDYQMKKERQADIIRLRTQIAAIEKEIAGQEQILEEINNQLQLPEVIGDYQAVKQYSDEAERHSGKLDKSYEQWERLSQEMHELLKEKE